MMSNWRKVVAHNLILGTRSLYSAKLDRDENYIERRGTNLLTDIFYLK